MQRPSIATSHASRDGDDKTTPSSDVSHDSPDTHEPGRPSLDEVAFGAFDQPSLPYRTVSENANLEEYTSPNALGVIPSRATDKTGKEVDWKLVTFKPDDKENPKTWSKVYKWYCTMVVAFVCFVVAFCSSVVTADIPGPSDEFGVSEEVGLLTITLFVVGFGVGPLFAAPLSEMYGRWIVYASTLLVAIIFIIPCAVSKNVATLLVCRAIDGIAFSAPMTLVGGTLADMWRPEERGIPMAAFSAAPFIGPAIGPLVGGYLSTLGWRWLYWIQMILAAAAWALIVFTVPETFAPTILARRAKRLRKESGDSTYTTELELHARPLGERLQIFMLRPLQLLFTELIVLLISLYMSVLYSLLYMFFVAFPVIYQRGKGWDAGKTGLMFIPFAVGIVGSACLAPIFNIDYIRRAAKYTGRPPAELRLIPMMFSCWFIPAALFAFAWSSYPQVSWAGPSFSAFGVGFGFIPLYNAANNYLVDSYQHQAASALAAKTFIRSLCGAAVVLFTEQMWDGLGYEWAGSVLAFISLACCAIPFFFYFQGAKVRARARFAYNGEDEEGEAKGSEKV